MQNLHLSTGTREEKYQALLPQLETLWDQKAGTMANLANTCAAIFQTFQFHWVGFYWVKNQELVLGPFQGPVACTRIQYGKGVCGTAWEKKTTLVVPDVDAFPGHIACSSLSRSELVFPIFSKKNEIIGVLDIDSSEPDDFSETDVQYLEKMLRNLSAILDPDFSA